MQEPLVNATNVGATALSPPVPRILTVLGNAASTIICDGWIPIKPHHVDECEPTLGLAVVAVFLAPFIWNTVARIEYYTHAVSWLLGRRIGCTVLAIWIFSFSLYRDALVAHAIRMQPSADHWDDTLVHVVGGICAVIGATFVLSSFIKLGFFGTYLGDYFGILMSEIVTGFPYTVTDHPMYDGSTLLFLSMSLIEKSPAGISITVWVFIVYRLFAFFEGNFTSRIYQEADAKKNARLAKSK